MHKIELQYIKNDEKLTSRQKRELEHNTAYSLLFKMLKENFNIDNPIIQKNENGKPFIDTKGVFFSISHTDGLVVCAVADTEIGVDCERVTTKKQDNIEKIANRFFVENEIDLLKKSNFSAYEFFKLWTAKEACVKKRGGNVSFMKAIDTTKENIQILEENGYIISINI